MTIDPIKTLLNKYHIHPKKTLGQNFLLDEIVMEDMLDAAKISEGDVVVEIGPGIGVFTERMLKRGARVLAIEKDQAFLPILKALGKQYKNFWYEMGDALRMDVVSQLRALNASEGRGNLRPKDRLLRSGLRSLIHDPSGDLDSSNIHNMLTPQGSYGGVGSDALPRNYDEILGYKVVANIPYYITGKLIQQSLRLDPNPQSITLLVQKEVAMNIAAKVPDMNLLAISVQLRARPTVVIEVPARSFYPPPKVDSAVVHMELPNQPPYKVPDEKFFWRVVRACFAGKRKQIHNTLKSNLGLSAGQVISVLEKVGVDEKIRPQHMSIPQWIKLVEIIEKQETNIR